MKIKMHGKGLFVSGIRRKRHVDKQKKWHRCHESLSLLAHTYKLVVRFLRNSTSSARVSARSGNNEKRRDSATESRLDVFLYNKLWPSLQHFGGLIWRPLQKVDGPGLVPERVSACGAAAAARVPLLLLCSVDRGHLVQAVLLGFEPQVGDAVGHVHALGRVGVGAGGRVGGHGAARREEGGGGEGYITCG